MRQAKQHNKAIYRWLIGLVVLLALACSSPPQQEEETIETIERDNYPPVLEQLAPDSLQGKGKLPLDSVKITGILKEDNELVKVIIYHKGKTDQVKADIDKQEDGLYAFAAEIPLVTGENTIVVRAEDQDGNILQKEISYLNEAALEEKLVLVPEHKELSVGGYTLFEIFLDNKPINPEKVKLSARDGSFVGSRYHAPSYRGRDVIKAHYAAERAIGETTIFIKKPEVQISCNGPAKLFRGKKAKYSLEIKNTGLFEAIDNQLEVKLPPGLKFKQADKSGLYRDRDKEISWKIKNIAVGGKEKLEFKVYGQSLVKNQMLITMHSCGERVWEKTFPVKVIGAIEIDHKVSARSIAVGKTVTFQVAITARQSLKSIQCEYKFPKQLIFVSAKLTTKDNSFNCNERANTVIIPLLASMAEDEQATLEVTFQANRLGELKNKFLVQFENASGKKAQLQDLATLYVQ